MLFNSFEYFFFLPLVFILYWLVFSKSLQWQNVLLLVASYFFYGWWSVEFLGLLLLNTFLDYGYGFGVASSNRHRAKLFLWLSIFNNLGILCVFKYYNFFAFEFQHAFASLGLYVHPMLLELGLPIGISFYTFHGMSYVIDIYRGQQKPVSTFVDYAVFVSFFPLLVAGPIERAHHLLPQIQSKRTFQYGQATEGCRLILWGLFKKVIVADSLGTIVDEIFLNYAEHSSGTLLLGAIGFSFQIYGDFSGYSDIALGTAKLFGFELLSNFKFPYFSRDLAEFWRRWHISLSNWFRDYLYIPLGGSKKGKLLAIRNTFIIFLVSGFWHGASWNFIFWGFLHACGFLPLLLLNRNKKNVADVVASHTSLPTLRELMQMTGTFAFVTIAWVFFRAESLTKAFDYLYRSVGMAVTDSQRFLAMPKGTSMFLYILPLLVGDWFLRHDERKLQVGLKPKVLRYALYILIAQLVYVKMVENLSYNTDQTFIYFQF